MSIHPDGTGTGWTNVELVDVNQPHGKDYLYSQHVAKGVRKRMNQEHSAFADATVGGIHKPGGCAVLGMEITDDCTAPLVDDGTYRGHGLIWAYSKDASNFGVLFCTTGAAGASTTGTDWTVLKMHPDLQWSGGDITWAGAHEFDASVDISGNVAMDGDLTIDGVLKVDSSCEISDVYVNGDISMTGTLKVATDFSLTGDMGIDGTSNFFDEADFSDVAVSGSFCLGTIVADTSGTITLPGGIIYKWGRHTRVGSDVTSVTFDTAFPNACWQTVATRDVTSSTSVNMGIWNFTTTGFEAFIPAGVIYWMAIGY